MKSIGCQTVPTCGAWRPPIAAIRAMGRLRSAARIEKFRCDPYDVGLLWNATCGQADAAGREWRPTRNLISMIDAEAAVFVQSEAPVNEQEGPIPPTTTSATALAAARARISNSGGRHMAFAVPAGR